MKEYFTGHRDAVRINEFLNELSQDSRGDCASIILQAYAIMRFAEVWYKLQRIWKTRWKHPLVYDEWWLPALVTRVWCFIRNEQIVED